MTQNEVERVNSLFEHLLHNPQAVIDNCCDYNYFLMQANLQYKKLNITGDRSSRGARDIDEKIDGLCSSRNRWYFYMDELIEKLVPQKLAQLDQSIDQFKDLFCDVFDMTSEEFDKRITPLSVNEDFSEVLKAYRAGLIDGQENAELCDMCKRYLTFRHESLLRDKLKSAVQIISKLENDIDQSGNPTFGCLKSYREVWTMDARLFAPLLKLVERELETERVQNERYSDRVLKLYDISTKADETQLPDIRDELENCYEAFNNNVEKSNRLNTLRYILDAAIRRQKIMGKGMEGEFKKRVKARFMDMRFGFPAVRIRNNKTYITEGELATIRKILPALDGMPKLQAEGEKLLADLEDALE